MPALGQTFNTDDVPPSDRNFDPLPDGIYDLQVIASDIVQTKAGNGEILKLTMEVIGGQYENRKVFVQINWSNPNAQAQQIGHRDFADLTLACGLVSVNDTDDLHFIPFKARIGIKKGDGQHADQNVVKKYLPVGGAPQSAPQPAQRQSAPSRQAAAPPQRPAAGNARPWK